MSASLYSIEHRTILHSCTNDIKHRGSLLSTLLIRKNSFSFILTRRYAAGVGDGKRKRWLARLSIHRMDVRQRVTLSAALALIHVGDVECYGNRHNKKRKSVAILFLLRSFSLHRSAMNLLHDRQPI